MQGRPVKITILVTLALALVGACHSPQGSEDSYETTTSTGDLIGQPDRSASSDLACRFEIAAERTPLELLELSADLRGRACVKDGQTLLFFPVDGMCSLDNRLASDAGTQMSAQQAEVEFWQCTAAGAAPSITNKETVLIWVPTEQEIPSSLHSRFISNIELLVVNDGLPISYYAVHNGVVCMEADDASAVGTWIASADLVRPRNVRIETDIGTCAENAARTTGRQWSPPQHPTAD